MQITSIVALLIAATGALAAPGSGKPGKHHKPSKPAAPVTQVISCGNNAAYCCNVESNGGDGGDWWGGKGGDGGDVSYTCSKYTANCNSIAVCCNNNDGDQACSMFGDAKVIFKDD